MTNHQLARRRRPLTIAVLAGALAIIATAVLAAGGSARTTGRSLHLHAKEQSSVGFTFKGTPRQGDTFGFGDQLTGTDTGSDRGVCTFIGQATALCTIHISLTKGTITAQGLLGQASRNTPVAITGGTGAYDGARGTARLTDLPSNQADIRISLAG